MTASVSRRSKPLQGKPYSIAIAFTNSSALITGFKINAVANFPSNSSSIARQLHKTLSFPDAIEQVIEGLPMFGAVKEEARVRGDIERRLGQVVVFKIHTGVGAKKVPAFVPLLFPPYCLKPGQV